MLNSLSHLNQTNLGSTLEPKTTTIHLVTAKTIGQVLQLALPKGQTEFTAPPKPLSGPVLLATQPQATFAYPIRKESSIKLPTAFINTVRAHLVQPSLPITLPVQSNKQAHYINVGNQVLALPLKLPSQGYHWLQIKAVDQWTLLQSDPPIKLKPLSPISNPQLPTNQPQPGQIKNLMPHIAAAKALPHGLQLSSAQGDLLLALPKQALSGSFLVQPYKEYVTLSPIIQQQSFTPARSVLSQLQPLSQASLPLVLPVNVSRHSAELHWAEQSIKLPLKLPSTGQYWLEIRQPKQWQLLQLGPATTLPYFDRTTLPEPAIQGRPLLLEQIEPSLLSFLSSKLTQPLGQSTLSQLPLASLAQLAHPTLLAELINQIGQFPYGQNTSPPLGPLANLWQRLLQQNSAFASNHLEPSNEQVGMQALRQEALAKLTPMIDELARFQQHSQADLEQPQLFIALPYGQEKQQRQLQIAIHGYKQQTDKQQDEGFWILSLRFELDTGHLLLRARCQQDQHLSIQAVASSSALYKAVTQRFELLQERFSLHGVTLEQLHCRIGDVPTSLATIKNTERLTYGQKYNNR